MSKYKNVSLTKETYATLDKLSKVLLPDAKLSIAKDNRINCKRESEEVKWQN